MKDPDFAREFEALRPEFEIVDQIVALRIKRGLTQKQLAEKIGTQQPSIARLERKRKATDLGFLRRVADALNADVRVTLVPRKAVGKRAGSKRMR
jgi:transcriptional regulator with XRE-family HTH domain